MSAASTSFLPSVPTTPPSLKLSEQDGHLGSDISKKLIPAEWPSHNEFSECSLVVKPDFLHHQSPGAHPAAWYLHIECQGCTPWRLTTATPPSSSVSTLQ
ncbi:hypothetical protein HYPSUDRAFT_204979 [Hypholoma sublateritium FD-334 SS-4]|uniref:Uncharacterized protein n=1 Tax=Hypholoma sublateritium (strain FD-334 SS-4) TaxID=945553 RepID=A0A0D2NJ25_HYPSF|nr:hypothetical protein HYPSUDRAFT_204979 [Hypholoma sublateritium FD-334 SS-4]